MGQHQSRREPQRSSTQRAREAQRRKEAERSRQAEQERAHKEEASSRQREIAQVRRMLGQSDYLIELYSETSDSWETFRSSRKPADLLHTANLLCTGLEGLQSDATFWSGVTYLAIQAHDEEQHEYVEDSLQRRS